MERGSGSAGGFGGARGGGAGRGGAGRRYTLARGRRVRENYRAPSRAPSRANRRGAGGSYAVPSRWFM